ncbi:MAG: pyridoxamine 5'-phosphate oxidase family protein [Humidesulfovibrio sp.]|nr:pyridoxamine 5'-phosphate oxidase family protein [Humidesulfovibrio sp.]
MRAMRKKEREISQEEAAAILDQGEYGVLSLVDADNTPYGLPLSYVYTDGEILIHCAPEGRKLDILRRNPAVSFCVVGETTVLPEKFTTRYESVIASGVARELPAGEKDAALLALVRKYAPEHEESGVAYIKSGGAKACAFAIRITALTGKARR